MAMTLWHLTSDAPRTPRRVSAGEPIVLRIGTWPIAAGESVWIEYQLTRHNLSTVDGRIEAHWRENAGPNSYWEARMDPPADCARVTYTVLARDADGEVRGPSASFKVGPKLYFALLWHHHQPIYKDSRCKVKTGSYRLPWVRLHGVRDYYSMAAIVADHPGMHLTINLTPSLASQIEDYCERGATDIALDLTLKPAEELSDDEKQYVLRNFFEADWHNQIATHPRYSDLFVKRRDRRQFTIQDLRDLQMWFNLAWFGKEFRDSEVRLTTGEAASVKRFIHQGRNYSRADIEAMVGEQFKIMRAVIPIHRELQARGQIEVSTTPFFHPILPLLVDTDKATIDHSGASYPPRFAHPQDAEAQIKLAAEWYEQHFGLPPRGMWPAEGAVSQSVVPLFEAQKVQWIATDQGVLARSGRWGYAVNDPEVLCQPYRAVEGDASISMFFRNTSLSDAIGFQYHSYADSEQAARDFLERIKEGVVRKLQLDEDRVLTVVLDGENAWGAYPEDARPFLHALYNLLERDNEISPVTFNEYIEGNADRGIPAHPIGQQRRVYDLFTGSWIDKSGSSPGVDLGTWIGQEEKNRAWALLNESREFLAAAGAAPSTASQAFQSLYTAEGSDWFWWFGDDHSSSYDEEFDNLFRTHLKNLYLWMACSPPEELDRQITPRGVKWTHIAPVEHILAGDRLTVVTHCPGRLTWTVNKEGSQQAHLSPVGGAMAGVNRYQVTLGPFAPETDIHFTFECMHEGCPGTAICCDVRPYRVHVDGRSAYSGD